MALDDWTIIDLTLQATFAPAAVGMRRIINWVRADAPQVSLLLARLGSDARHRGAKTDNARDMWACVRSLMGFHEIFWPGANSKNYQHHAIGARYHMRWSRLLLWRSLDRLEPSTFDKAADATKRARDADYSCGEGVSQSACAARAEILAEKYRCTQGDDPNGELWTKIEEAFKELETEAAAIGLEPMRSAELYEALGYDWTRLMGGLTSVPDASARTAAIKYYQLANKSWPDERRRKIIEQLQKKDTEKGSYVPIIPDRTRTWWHRHLPWTAYGFLAGLGGIGVILRSFWPPILALAGRSLGWRLGLGGGLALLGAAWLITGLWILKIAFTAWNREIHVGATDLSNRPAISDSVTAT